MRRRWKSCAKFPAGPDARRLAGVARTWQTAQTLQPRLRAAGISFYVFCPDNPFRVDAQAAIRPPKHQRGTLIALELPVQPSYSNAAEFSAVWFAISAAVPDSSFVGTKRRDFCQVIEIGLGIFERDVSRIPADVRHGNVNRFQVLLTQSFSSAEVGRLGEEPAVPNDGSADATVRGNFNGLHPAARLAHHRDFAAIEPFVILAGGTIVLRGGPLDCIDHLGWMSCRRG